MHPLSDAVLNTLKEISLLVEAEWLFLGLGQGDAELASNGSC